MSRTALRRIDRAIEPEPEELVDHFVLHNISWSLYESILKAVGNRPVSVTFYEGSLEFMTPLPSHEIYKTLLARMIEILSFELDIPMAGLGSTTYKSKKRLSGLEPDECYYIKNEAKIRGKKRLNLEKDPPPDLAIEVDITHRAIDREKIYAALGVPEVWRLRLSRVACLQLKRDGTYEEHAESAAFAGLKMTTLEEFLAMAWTTDQTSIVRAFSNWVKKNMGS